MCPRLCVLLDKHTRVFVIVLPMTTPDPQHRTHTYTMLIDVILTSISAAQKETAETCNSGATTRPCVGVLAYINTYNK